MGKHIYISSDYDEGNGDREVVEEFYKWNNSNRHSLEFADLAKVAKGSVSSSSDCRICDLKKEFNNQINSCSAVVFVIGDKTKSRTAGTACDRCGRDSNIGCYCTPYKQNSNGSKLCRYSVTYSVSESDDVGCINGYSYLQHEFEQAKKKGKQIIVVYNSLRKQPSWLPNYMAKYADEAQPFWKMTECGNVIGNYDFIKNELCK